MAAAVAAVAGIASAGASAQPGGAGLAGDFEAAAQRSHVPATLLEAMGYVNARWQTPRGPSLDGGWGIMHLVDRGPDGQLAQAARATGLPAAALRRDPAANLRGGAALLAQAAGPDRPRTLAAWYPAVARLGGSRAYADQVYATLTQGAQARVDGRTLTLRPQPGAAGAGAGARAAQAAPADYPAATWHPASWSNYAAANRPVSGPIDKIVIHATEGSWSSAWNWFADPRAQASAHYIVRSSDGAIAQSVREHDVAWHAGNRYTNATSIGIEHEAFTGNCAWYTTAMYRSSARLVAHLAMKYGIPVDRRHIIGHSEVPDPNHPGQYGGFGHHTDPGPCWNWSRYMGMVRSYLPGASSARPTYRQEVNDSDPVRFHASGAWKRSPVGAARVASPKAVSDPASYLLHVPVTGTYAVYARWPSSSRWSTSAPIAVQTADGVQWVRVDQRANGGRWVLLGRFRLAAGDGWDVRFSRWTFRAGTIVADRVKIEG